MEIDDSVQHDSYIDLIPYLFLALETIETTLACNLATETATDSPILLKKGSQQLEVSLNKSQQAFLNNEDNLLLSPI